MTMQLTICVAALSLMAPRCALAQSPGVPFVEAGPLLNQDMSWGAGRSITNAGLSVGAGVRIGARTEIRALIEIPPATELAFPPTSYYDGNPPVVVFRLTTHPRARDRSVSILFGRTYRVATRVELEPSIGWSIVHRSDGTTTTVEKIDPKVNVPQVHSAVQGPELGEPVFGLAGIVRLTRHLSLVPEARMIWVVNFENGNRAIVRLNAGARWIF